MKERKGLNMEVYDSSDQRFSFSSWDDFLGNWEEYGVEFVRLAVKHPDFMDWLKVVQPARAELVEKVLRNDAYLTDAFLTMDDERVQKGHPTFKQIAELVTQSVADPEEHVPQLLEALNGRSGSLLPAKGLAEEITFWQAKLENEKRKEPKPGDEMTVTLPGGVPMTFCWCPATTSEDWKRLSGGADYFRMGSPETEAERENDEKQHRVTLTQGFWMGKFPVTQKQWTSVMGSNPSQFNGGDRPVERVAWEGNTNEANCLDFIRKINESGDVKVALPTEAQWEYACRAGTTTPFSFGSTLNGDLANCNGRHPYGMTAGHYREQTSPVGSYAPNAWGLHDMHGNVLEWCADRYGDYTGDSTDPTGPTSGDDRVLRGGGWCYSAEFCRSAYRDECVTGIRNYNLGLRLVCSAGPRR